VPDEDDLTLKPFVVKRPRDAEVTGGDVIDTDRGPVLLDVLPHALVGVFDLVVGIDSLIDIQMHEFRSQNSAKSKLTFLLASIWRADDKQDLAATLAN
jgi:hypothetical protein